jgi:hypothetical protein
MIKLNSLLLLIFLFSLKSFAQSNFKPGLIVNLKGDTTHGFVDYREWGDDPVSINFKAALNGPVQTYTPNDIEYFSIDKFVAYQKYSGKISTDQTNISNLSHGRDTSTKTAIVFLKLEQKGMYLTLYSYTDAVKVRYFVSTKDEPQPVELINRVYYVADSPSKTVDENTYKGQLIFLSSRYNGDSNDIRTLLNNVRYNDDLVNAVEKINHFKKQKDAHKKSNVTFFAGISSGLTSIKPPIDHNSFDPQIKTTASSIPKIFVGINSYVNPDIGTVIFRIEASVAENNMQTTFKALDNPDQRSDLMLNQLNIALSPAIIYTIYNTNPFKIYLEGGLNLNFSSYSKNYLYDSSGALGVLNASAGWISIPFTAGVLLNNKLGIFATYILPSKVSGESYKLYSEQIGITYDFGHKR